MIYFTLFLRFFVWQLSHSVILTLFYYFIFYSVVAEVLMQ